MKTGVDYCVVSIVVGAVECIKQIVLYFGQKVSFELHLDHLDVLLDNRGLSIFFQFRF